MNAPGKGPRRIGLRRGRQGPTYTDVPDFVTWLVPCPTARELYRVLTMHSANDIRPSLAALADLLGLTREDKVNPFMTKLIDAGLVSKTLQGMPGRNVYTIRDLPPDDYDGPINLPGWYEQRGKMDADHAVRRPRTGREKQQTSPHPGSSVPLTTTGLVPAQRRYIPDLDERNIAYGSVVYYLRHPDGLIKIGVSKKITDRLYRSRQLLGPVDLLATEPGWRSLERQRHRQFAHLRMDGLPMDRGTEWFRSEADLLAHVESLAVAL